MYQAGQILKPVTAAALPPLARADGDCGRDMENPVESKKCGDMGRNWEGGGVLQNEPKWDPVWW